MRHLVTLECSECKSKNYHSEKNKRNTPDRLELKKLCKKCKKMTSHKESKSK
uniref:Large ribosomal subunit protein bL33 n=1 Tax=candidate division CPR3 bacterium TaxID=2268181 RepID=A0A7C4R7M4_UNCC3